MFKIHNLNIYSQSKKILHINELLINAGTFVYVYGGNSTGKSIFLSSIGGFYGNFDGTMTFKNQKLKPNTKHNNILMINNELPVIEYMTFLENIEIPLGKNNLKVKKRLLEMASIVDIIDLLNVKMVYCSRSERVLMYLVRAALVNPYILLIDDLDTFFDAEKLKNVQQLLSYFLSSGMSIIATGKTVLENVCTYCISNSILKKVI